MLLKRLVPALLTAVAAAPAAAATAAERATHFDAVASLIRNELRLPAQHQLELFQAAGYQDPDGVWSDGLQWYFADTFGLLLGGEEGKRLSEQAEQLQAKLQAAGDLPPTVAAVAQFTGRTTRLAQRLSREFANADLPPPLVPVPEARRTTRAKLVAQLLEAARSELGEQMAEIKAFEPQVEQAWSMDQNDPKYWKIMRNATMLRNAYANTLYQAYKPLREIVVRERREQQMEAPRRVYHFSPETMSGIKGFLREFMGGENGELFSNWDWSYGDYFPYLKHRLAVHMSEKVRQQKVAETEVERSGLGYDDVRGAFFQVIDLNTDTIGDRNARAEVENLKLFVWADLFYWHLAMGDNQSLVQAEKLWQEFESRMDDNRQFGLTARDQVVQIMAGHLNMLRARIALTKGDASTFSRIMAEIQSSGNYFAANAKRWISWSVTNPPPSNQDPWVLPPKAGQPASAITVAKALHGEAGQLVDIDKINQLYEQAAGTLRDAVLGLPAADAADADFVRYAPDVYRLLAISLYKRGWYGRAAIVCQEGLNKFWPERWGDEPSNDNPFFERGKLTEAGAAVQVLSSYYVSFASAYYDRTRSQAANALFDEALALQKQFDPAASGDSAVLTRIKLLFGQGEYREAAKLSGELYEDKKKAIGRAKSGEEKIEILSEATKALYFQTMATYSLWNQLREEGAPEADIERVGEEFQEHADQLGKLGQMADNPKVPDKFKPAFVKAKQEGLRFTVDRYFRSGEYDQVLAVLDADFWADPPRDSDQVERFLQIFAGSVYNRTKELAAQVRDQAAAAGSDPAKVTALVNETASSILAHWAATRRAYQTYQRMVRAMPALEVGSQAPRRILAANFNTLQSLLGQLVVPNATKGEDRGAGRVRAWATTALQTRAGADGSLSAEEWPSGELRFESVPGVADGLLAAGELTDEGVLAAFLRASDPAFAAAVDIDDDGQITAQELDSATATEALAQTMADMAKRGFADLYEPLLTEDADPQTVLAVAQTLWALDEKERAAPLYERYKAKKLADPALTRLASDPMAVIEEVKAKVALRSELQEAWEYHPKDPKRKGSITDYLVDQPGFLDQFYTNRSVRRSEWPEEKADYARALGPIREFRELFDARKGLIRDSYDEGVEALEAFEQQVRDLAFSINIDTRLIQAYREMGQLDKAVSLAEQLFDYDPLDPTFMATMVEGVLEQVRRQGTPEEEQIEKARQIAFRLQQDSQARGDFVNQWRAANQLLELSKPLGAEGMEYINDRLSSHVRRNNLPTEDLFEAVGDDFEPGSISEGYGLYRREQVRPGVDGAVTSVGFVGIFSREDMQLIERYLALYELDGVTIDAPLEIVTETVSDLAGGTMEVPVVQKVGLQVPTGEEQ